MPSLLSMAEHISLWNDLCRQHAFSISVTVVEGGASRYESVKNALSAIESSDGIVAVHDGARPLVTERITSIASSIIAGVKRR